MHHCVINGLLICPCTPKPTHPVVTVRVYRFERVRKERHMISKGKGLLLVAALGSILAAANPALAQNHGGSGGGAHGGGGGAGAHFTGGGGGHVGGSGGHASSGAHFGGGGGAHFSGPAHFSGARTRY